MTARRTQYAVDRHLLFEQFIINHPIKQHSLQYMQVHQGHCSGRLLDLNVSQLNLVDAFINSNGRFKVRFQFFPVQHKKMIFLYYTSSWFFNLKTTFWRLDCVSVLVQSLFSWAQSTDLVPITGV
jgi:hypothetical protein